MNRILRHVVVVDGDWHAFTLTHTPLHVATRAEDKVELWAVNDDGPTTVRRFRAFATGEPLPDFETSYIGSAITPSGEFVWHLIEDVRQR